MYYVNEHTAYGCKTHSAKIYRNKDKNAKALVIVPRRDGQTAEDHSEIVNLVGNGMNAARLVDKNGPKLFDALLKAVLRNPDGVGQPAKIYASVINDDAGEIFRDGDADRTPVVIVPKCSDENTSDHQRRVQLIHDGMNASEGIYEDAALIELAKMIEIMLPLTAEVAGEDGGFESFNTDLVKESKSMLSLYGQDIDEYEFNMKSFKWAVNYRVNRMINNG